MGCGDFWCENDVLTDDHVNESVENNRMQYQMTKHLMGCCYSDRRNGNVDDVGMNGNRLVMSSGICNDDDDDTNGGEMNDGDINRDVVNGNANETFG